MDKLIALKLFRGHINKKGEVQQRRHGGALESLGREIEIKILLSIFSIIVSEWNFDQ